MQPEGIVEETTVYVLRRGRNDVCALTRRELTFKVLEMKTSLGVVARHDHRFGVEVELRVPKNLLRTREERILTTLNGIL